jgi:hypothetical protein
MPLAAQWRALMPLFAVPPKLLSLLAGKLDRRGCLAASHFRIWHEAGSLACPALRPLHARKLTRCGIDTITAPYPKPTSISDEALSRATRPSSCSMLTGIREM